MLAGDEDADIIARAVALLLRRHDAQACAELTRLPLADPIPAYIPASGDSPADLEPMKPEPLDNRTRVVVYRRDGWRCRYCGRKVVFPGVLEVLRLLCPDFKGLLSGHHMPADKTEPAVQRVYPNVDHVHAVSLGGSWRDEGNHVTACTPCNTRKSNRSAWAPGPILVDHWDGLAASYKTLAERAGPLTRQHRHWLKALGL